MYSSPHEIFEVGHLVEALDEVCIWWPATIIDFKSEWEIKVKWSHFTSRPSSAYSIIRIPDAVQHQQENWNIRFPKTKPANLPQKRHRSKQEILKYNPRFQSRQDEVKTLKLSYSNFIR